MFSELVCRFLKVRCARGQMTPGIYKENRGFDKISGENCVGPVGASCADKLRTSETCFE